MTFGKKLRGRLNQMIEASFPSNNRDEQVLDRVDEYGYLFLSFTMPSNLLQSSLLTPGIHDTSEMQPDPLPLPYPR